MLDGSAKRAVSALTHTADSAAISRLKQHGVTELHNIDQFLTQDFVIETTGVAVAVEIATELIIVADAGHNHRDDFAAGDHLVAELGQAMLEVVELVAFLGGQDEQQRNFSG